MEDFGAAFTGQRPTDPATATNQWDSWMERPGNRQALLQMGLQMMQPVAMGQTVGGHIGQAVGAGGEAMTRNAILDEKSAIADVKLAQADEKLRITQQNADSGAIRAGAAAARSTSKGIKGLTEAFRATAARQDQRRYEDQLDEDARLIAKNLEDLDQDLITGKERKAASSEYKKYAGKSALEIRESLRKERPVPKYGNIPSNDTAPLGEDLDPEAPPAAAASALTTPKDYPEAKQGRDPKTGLVGWYVQRNGKNYLVGQ